MFISYWSIDQLIDWLINIFPDLLIPPISSTAASSVVHLLTKLAVMAMASRASRLQQEQSQQPVIVRQVLIKYLPCITVDGHWYTVVGDKSKQQKFRVLVAKLELGWSDFKKCVFLSAPIRKVKRQHKGPCHTLRSSEYNRYKVFIQ